MTAINLKELAKGLKIEHTGPKNATLEVFQGTSPYPVPPPGVTPDWYDEAMNKEKSGGETHS